MFYQPVHGHGLPYDPFKAILSPRPIGWISTVDLRGRHNLAPYSFFSAISSNPHMIGFSSEGLKDSIVNARETGEFVYNLVSIDLINEMNISSSAVGSHIDEFELADLLSSPSSLVKARRVAKSPAAMECKVVSCTQLEDCEGSLTNRYLVIGQVIGSA